MLLVSAFLNGFLLLWVIHLIARVSELQKEIYYLKSGRTVYEDRNRD